MPSVRASFTVHLQTISSVRWEIMHPQTEKNLLVVEDRQAILEVGLDEREELERELGQRPHRGSSLGPLHRLPLRMCKNISMRMMTECII
jgi:hypothetical protein